MMTTQQLRESLNEMDKKALDEDAKYYDLLNLFEAVRPLNNNEKKMLNDATKTGKPAVVDSVLQKIQLERNPALKKQVEKATNAPTAAVAESADNFAELNKIYDEEEALDEGRRDLVPKKCHALASHKVYYSPYDMKEKRFAQYGTRFRYDTKEGCLDAINDLENDLGYDYEMKHEVIDAPEEKKKDENLNEAYKNYEVWDENGKCISDVFDEKEDAIEFLKNTPNAYKVVKYLSSEDGEDVPSDLYDVAYKSSKGIIKNESLNEAEEFNDYPKVVVASDSLNDAYEDAVLQMTQRAYKPATGITCEIWILVKLYKYTNGGTITQVFKGKNCTNPVLRSTLLKAIGYPQDDNQLAGDTTGNTWFGHLSRDGYIQYAGDSIVGTAKLKPFIEGQNQFKDASGIDFRDWNGSKHVDANGNPWDPELRNYGTDAMGNPLSGRESQGATPNRSNKGTRDKGKGGSTFTPNPSAQPAQPAQPAEPQFKRSAGFVKKARKAEESLDEAVVRGPALSGKEIARQCRMAKRREAQNEEIRQQFRKYRNLDESAEITKDDLGTQETFKYFCWLHNYAWDRASEALIGKDK